VASKDKPYRVYRGGRARGPVTEAPPRGRGRPDGDGYRGPQAPRRRNRRPGRWIALVLALLVVLVLVWLVLGYLAFRSGVEEANERLDRRANRALTAQESSLLTNPSNTLVLGADVGPQKGRRGQTGRSDSIMLVRSDPDENRISYLFIPRDLRVEIPGRGADKINAAYSYGGPALAIDTVEQLTGLDVHHVVVVDFGTFAQVIDAVGGVTVNVPKPILSNKFDCPYATEARCDEWRGWRFRKGPQEMSGHRALIYSRIRQNQLDPGESDITRGERQQRVTQALLDRITSFQTFVRLPAIGDDLVKPMATDLSAGEILQLGWVKFRSSDDKSLRCRLGGDPAVVGGASVLQSSEDNALTIAMITGDTAPQRPPRNQPFAPGCFVGR
jgi:LCP family protein required for cell wall assembly